MSTVVLIVAVCNFLSFIKTREHEYFDSVKRENKEAKYVIVFQMKIIAEIKIHVKINMKATSIFFK